MTIPSSGTILLCCPATPRHVAMPDHQSPLKLSHLQMLVAVADCGSFSEAAAVLQLSQSAVSYAIAALENELGVILLARGRHGAHPTPVGEQIVQRSRRVIDLLNDITQQANLSKGLQGGYVRIAAFRSAASHILPEVIAEFCRRYPAIAVNIAEYDDRPEVEESLRRGHSDIGITYLPADPGLETWELMRDEFVVLVPPTLPCEDEVLSWPTLKKHPLIMAPVGDFCDAMVYDHCQAHGVALHPTYQVRSDATIVNMVAKGLGITISPRLATEPIPAGARVFSLPVPLFRVISVATVEGALLTPAAFTFLDVLREMGCETQR